MDFQGDGSESIKEDDRPDKKRPREDNMSADKRKVQIVIGGFAPLSASPKEQINALHSQQQQQLNIIEIDGSSSSSSSSSLLSPQKSAAVVTAAAVIAQQSSTNITQTNNPTTASSSSSATATATVTATAAAPLVAKIPTSSGATGKSSGGQTTSKKASGSSASQPQKASSLIPNVFCPILSPTTAATATTSTSSSSSSAAPVVNEEISIVPPSDVHSKLSSLSIKYNQEKDITTLTPKAATTVVEKSMNWIVVGNVIKTVFGAHDFIAVATSRDEVHVFNAAALNVPTLPIICDASIADLILSTSSSYDSVKCMLCVITCNGCFNLWSLSPFKSVISQASILPIIKKLLMPIKTPYSDSQTCSFHLGANGVLAAIVVAKSNQPSSTTTTTTSSAIATTTTIIQSAAALAAESENSVFVFNKAGMCWNRIIDPKRFGRTQFFLSALSTSATKGKKSFYSEVLTHFLEACDRHKFELPDMTGLSAADSLLKRSSSIGAGPLGFGNFNDTSQEHLTLLDLELKLQIAVQLGCELSFRSWLVLYVARLAASNNTKRVKTLCDEYLGPRSKMNWESTILGKKKHDILREIILPTLSRDLQFQRYVDDVRMQLDNQQQSVAVINIDDNDDHGFGRLFDIQNGLSSSSSRNS